MSAAAFRSAMSQTYELYLHDRPGEAPRPRPLVCEWASQVMERARRLLAEDAGVASVEVRIGGEHLFTLAR
jgi:hypothetical protein